MRRNSVSATVYLLLVIVAILSRIWEIPYGRETGVALTALFLALELFRTPRLQLTVGVIIGGAGIFAAWMGDNVGPAVFDALQRSQTFMVMFFAVLWLRDPAITSPSLHEFRDAVVRQPPGRRYPILWLSTHFLGAVLNLASMSLLSVMAAEQTDKRLRRRLSIALMMGFTCASAWGPFYVSVSVILSAIPSVSWIDIAPVGMVLSVLMLGVGWSYDRIFLRQAPSPTQRVAGEPLTLKTISRTALILLQLAFLVLATHYATKLPIPIALGVIGPPFAILWSTVQAGSFDGGRRLAGRIFEIIPDLRNEAVAFSAASLFGVGVAQILPPEIIGEYIKAWGLSGDAVLVAVTFGMIIASFFGLHPVILVILVGEVMPPEVIGVAPELLAMALLGVWGVATMISPFSATTLFMSRIINVPSHIIAWRWDAPIVAITATVVAIYVVALRHLFYS